MTKLSEAVRLIRVFHDMNQTELARKLKISKSYLSEIESGKKQVSVDLLGKYAKIFKVPVSSLLLFSEKLESNPQSEKIRTSVAVKILKLMDWIDARESGGREKIA